jgi:hypothetical protein
MTTKSAQTMSARETRLMWEFVQQIARLETEHEINERTDYEGMSGDDAVETLSGLISQARKLVN